MTNKQLKNLKDTLWTTVDQLRANSGLKSTEYVKSILGLTEISLLTLYFYKIPFFSLLCARSLSIRKNTHKLPLSHL